MSYFVRRMFSAAGSIIAVLLFSTPLFAQSFSDPSTSETFTQAINGLSVVAHYDFGTGAGRNVPDLASLAKSFNPYGISGTTVINQEWERYQPFNTSNFVFTPNSLNITATIPNGGGLFAGGINSGQIWTKGTFQPGKDNKIVYAFEVRMKVPQGVGMWPAAWLFTKTPGIADTSEIDNPEFFNMKWQNEFDWTSSLHGPGLGPSSYSIRTNPWVWHPGLNFSADYHEYQTLWTEDMVYAYLDGTLISAQAFKWTSKGEPQFGINLAVGSDGVANLPGLQPNSLSEFPAVLAVDHFTVWAQ